jgi:2-oxoisovalerate dehydrogenase E2 component (dihydrolipoyl transacylase)
MSTRVVASLRRCRSSLTGHLGRSPTSWASSRHCCCLLRKVPSHFSYIRSSSPRYTLYFHRELHSTVSSETGRTPFLLADIGEGIKEVEVLQWHVAPGDRVQQFDPICTVQSDKATVEITSRYDGIIASLASDAPGAMLQVGQPLLYFAAEPAEVPATPPDGSASAVVTEAVNEKEEKEEEEKEEEERAIPDDPIVDESFRRPATTHSVQASPAVRKLLREHGIALDAISGTGPQQRVLKSDVLTHLEARHGDAAATPPTTPPSARGTALYPTVDDLVIPIRGVRRHMVQTMTAALQIPHMCLGDEVILNELLALRKEWNLTYEGRDIPSLLAWMLKALSAALRDYPLLNAIHTVSPDDGSFAIVQRRDHNIGVAMDTPHGLIVPVLKSCQQLSLNEIEAQLQLLQRLAMENALTPAHISDRTFTLSNVGSLGAGDYLQPVLVPPALAMGALGRMRTVPRYRDDLALYPATVLPVTWAADHRFVDGATVARFHRRWAEYIERPFRMLAQWQ